MKLILRLLMKEIYLKRIQPLQKFKTKIERKKIKS